VRETCLKDEVERYVKWLETTPGRGRRKRSSSTVRLYRSIVGIYARWAEEKGFSSFLEIPPEAVEEYVLTYKAVKNVWAGRKGDRYGRYEFTRKQGGEVSTHWRNTIIKALTHLYVCLTGDEENEWSQRLRKLAIRPERTSRVEKPSDLLTEEEIRSMLRVAEADSPLEAARNKALLAFLYESGCRVGEVASIKLGDVTPTDYGLRVTVKGKTGVRVIPLVDSARYLSEWLNAHPRGDDPNAPLFVCLSTNKWGQPLGRHGIRGVITKLARRAGVKKRIYPHLFRHTRATVLARVLSEASLKKVMGWSPSSPMAQVYVHLSGRDVEEDLLMARGLKPKVEPVSLLEVRKCPFCGFDNDAWAEYCVNCGKPLGARVIAELAEAQEVNKRIRKLEREFEAFRQFVLAIVGRWRPEEAQQLIEMYEKFKKAGKMVELQVSTGTGHNTRRLYDAG